MAYDVAIVGGGPAGYLAAERASEAGLTALLVEENKVGGVCLNEGCIPTKALLNSAKNNRKHADAMTNKDKVVTTLVRGVTATLKAKKVEVVAGTADVAKKSDQFEILVGEERYLANQVLLATGSVAAIPPIDGLSNGMQNGFVLTSREILNLETLPGKLVISGGGVIGLEMAVYFRSMGSEVTIVEALLSVGGSIEPEAAAFLVGMLRKKKIEVFTDAKVTAVTRQGVAIETKQGQKELAADTVLLCVGRRPAVGQFQKLGVLIENGAVKTDNHMRTSVRGVYAAGDINGKYMLAHTAYREAEVAVNNMAGTDDTMDYRAVPGVIYTSPEVAFVGLLEQEAKLQYANVVATKTSINISGRHVAEQGLSDGFCKLVVDKDKNIILGATIVGAYASEIIYSLCLMIQNKIPIDAVKKTIFPHPSVSEVIRESIFSI
jgi:Pyruvate/2-oxoglutarate dehydrogenase complex, dihydrolipoamide dehydrogenase (E3) component, and related enzymes